MMTKHIADDKARPSTFFKYKVYSIEQLPQQSKGEITEEVLIVGAGPIGLSTALDLARFGIRSRIIEAERQVSHGSRAIVLTRRSMEILQMLGVEKKFVNKGLAWNKGRSFYRNQEIYQMKMPDSVEDRFAPATNIQQQYIEQFLVEAAQLSPLINIHWGHKLTHIEQDEHSAKITLSHLQGVSNYRAKWVIAADGGRSTLRKLLGLRMEGETYSGNFVIADIKADINLPTERLCYFDPPWSPGNNVLIHREPEGIWRLDFRLPDGESPEQAIQDSLLADRINKILSMIKQPVDWQLDWATVYSASTKTLNNYRSNRTLFVGDAAHLLPIFGVRGANTGFQDSNNLAWKLALHMQGKAGEELLESYSTERVQAAKEICEEAGKSTRFMSPPSRGSRLLRDAVLSLSISESFCRDLLHWRTSRPHSYEHSPLTLTQSETTGYRNEYFSHELLGKVMPNYKFDRDHYLLDECLFGFTLLIFSEKEINTKSLYEAASHIDFKIVQISNDSLIRTGRNGIEASAKLKKRNIYEHYRVPSTCALLLRPDQHVSATWQTKTYSRLAHEQLKRWVQSALNKSLCLNHVGTKTC